MSSLKVSVVFYNVFCRLKYNLSDCNDNFPLEKFHFEVKPKLKGVSVYFIANASVLISRCLNAIYGFTNMFRTLNNRKFDIAVS